MGFVGNTVAGPVITHLGHHPLLVNTVLLAAHPGFNVIAGGPINHSDFQAIIEGIPTLGIIGNIRSIITGYLGEDLQVEPIKILIKRWKSEPRNGPYVLDPVLGDDGRLYVSHKLAKTMKDELLSLADFITPNQFELELLSDIAINDTNDAKKAMNYLLEKHPQISGVIATGICNGDNLVHDLFASRDEILDLSYEKLISSISGSGDLFTSIFTSWLTAKIPAKTSFTNASEQTHDIMSQSSSSLQVDLLQNLKRLKTIPDHTK